MAIIYSYPRIPSLEDKDLLLISDSSSKNKDTRSVTLGDLSGHFNINKLEGVGTINTIPLFTDSSVIGDSIITQATELQEAKRITVSGGMNITGTGGNTNGGTLNLTNSSARLGIRTPTPEASLDVGGNARVRGSLNVGDTTEQYLFVSTTGDNPVGYVKMGYYGTGVEWGSSTSSTRTPQYVAGFGSGGKVVEDARYYTFRITFQKMATIFADPKILIPQDDGPYTYIVEDFYLYQDNSASGQLSTIFNSDLTLNYVWTPAVGSVRTGTAWTIPVGQMNYNRGRKKLIIGTPTLGTYGSTSQMQEGSGDSYARASVVLTSLTAPTAASGVGDYYLRLKVKKINVQNDIINNAQLITVPDGGTTST
jgi:hypothetical protein